MPEATDNERAILTAASLTAMASYPEGHLWDGLDSQVCKLAAELLQKMSLADAYAGARKDLAIWKRRALEAENLPPPDPITEAQALQLWHDDKEAHRRVSAFEWFAAGLIAAQKHYGIKP